MADSKHTGLDNAGLMTAAMAYRVKYRKVNAIGMASKMHVHVVNAGVHKNNRGGMYPAGIRCKSLCVDVVSQGFLKEEVNHVCIAVEEAPVQEIIKSGRTNVVTSTMYNVESSCKDDILSTCFQAPYNDVRVSLLSHCHMMLVLRAFLTQAQWDIPYDKDHDITYCDADGKLSLTAVAASDQGKELAEVVAEGFYTELLSWVMDVEEPRASAIISQAMNLPHQMAMRTSELTAISLLKGEIIAQSANSIGQRVAFQTVRDKLRSQLHHAADDPDLPEVFDFLISNGVGTNSYVDDMLEWTAIYVESNTRQLRFGAFAIVNKMNERAAWAKMAVIKRAFRKSPSNGWCPSPEALWGTIPWEHLQILEDLLRFFHVACKHITDAMTPKFRITLMANIDIAAADTFFAAKDPKLKNGPVKIQQLLLDATRKYLKPFGLDGCKDKLAQVSCKAEWIVFSGDVEPSAVAKSPAPTVNNGPTVIKFDEVLGIQLNQQVSFERTVIDDTPVPRKLPWRDWYNGAGSHMGNAEADKAAAVAVLHGIHATFATTDELIEVWTTVAGTSQKIHVTSTCNAIAKAILLPPCIPRQSKVLTASEHPYAVQMTATVRRRPDQTKPGSDDTATRTTTYWLNPEFTTPTPIQGTPISYTSPSHAATPDSGSVPVAAVTVPVAAVAVPDAAVADEWTWTGRDETMNPFWAVRRMTKDAMEKAVKATPAGTTPPRFNCALEKQQVSCVTNGVVKSSQAVNTTRVYDVPFLVNFIDVTEGEELILEVNAKKVVKKVVKRTWRDAHKDSLKDAAQDGHGGKSGKAGKHTDNP